VTGLATAIRLRRRELDALALTLAAEQAAADALSARAGDLARKRTAERFLSAAAPFPCDAWFAEGTRQLSALARARTAADRSLADLRAQAVQARARLQLLEDAAAEKLRAERRRRNAKAEAALDDRIAAAWARR
jgi:hypothetical protein